MSTEGFAEVISILSNSLSGMGKLVSKSASWCGKKMEQSYQNFASSFQHEYQVELPSPAQLAARQRAMVRVIEQISASGVDTSDQNAEEIAQMLRKALESMDQSQQTLAEQEYQYARHLLQAEIKKCQGFVPIEEIIAAKQVQDGSLVMIQAAYQTLQQAWVATWDATDDTQTLRELHVQQTTIILNSVRQEMVTLRTLFSSNDPDLATRSESELQSIEKTIQIASQRIGPDPRLQDPQKALEDAQMAQKELQKLKQSVAHTLSEEWNKLAQRLAEARGKLKALETMIQDAVIAQVIDPGKSQTFLVEQIQPIHEQLAMIQAHPDQENEAALQTNIAEVEQQTFRLLGEGQQTRTAALIASTLSDLGFVSNPSTNEEPSIDKIGSSVRVVGTQNGKLTTFYIERDGDVSYDLSGYQGLECTLMANRIFSALRQKGLIIVDTEGAQRLNQRPFRSLTPELLLRDEFAPQFHENKRQAEIHEHVLQVLQETMGFTQILQNSSGGSIVIDAFQGHIGYHIVLSNEGKHTIVRHADDGLQDSEDQLARALEPLSPLAHSLPTPTQSAPDASETRHWEQPAQLLLEGDEA